MERVHFETMPLADLAAWVRSNDCLGYDELPPIDDCTDEEEAMVREEYEAAANEISIHLSRDN